MTNRGYGIVNDIHINVFRSRKDNRVRPLPTTWENTVGLFMSGHEVVENKEDVKLFNATHYKEVDQIPDASEDWYMDSQGFSYAKRRQINIVEVDLLLPRQNSVTEASNGRVC